MIQSADSDLFALRGDAIHFPPDFLASFSLARTTSLE